MDKLFVFRGDAKLFVQDLVNNLTALELEQVFFHTPKDFIPMVSQQTRDSLTELFHAQEKLNDYVFKKQQIAVPGQGHLLTMGGLFTEAKQAADNPEAYSLGPNSLVNTWMLHYRNAILSEMKELTECLLWKWWSKDKLDLQNIRVEIIDVLHFWISLALTAGLTSEDVFRIYMAKNKVNLERQDAGYNQANKTEEDNRQIK